MCHFRFCKECRPILSMNVIRNLKIVYKIHIIFRHSEMWWCFILHCIYMLCKKIIKIHSPVLGMKWWHLAGTQTPMIGHNSQLSAIFSNWKKSRKLPVSLKSTRRDMFTWHPWTHKEIMRVSIMMVTCSWLLLVPPKQLQLKARDQHRAVKVENQRLKQ